MMGIDWKSYWIEAGRKFRDVCGRDWKDDDELVDWVLANDPDIEERVAVELLAREFRLMFHEAGIELADGQLIDNSMMEKLRISCEENDDHVS